MLEAIVAFLWTDEVSDLQESRMLLLKDNSFYFPTEYLSKLVVKVNPFAMGQIQEILVKLQRREKVSYHLLVLQDITN